MYNYRDQGNYNPLSYLLQEDFTLKKATYSQQVWIIGLIVQLMLAAVLYRLRSCALETYPFGSYPSGECRCIIVGFYTVLLLHS